MWWPLGPPGKVILEAQGKFWEPRPPPISTPDTMLGNTTIVVMNKRPVGLYALLL